MKRRHLEEEPSDAHKHTVFPDLISRPLSISLPTSGNSLQSDTSPENHSSSCCPSFHICQIQNMVLDEFF